MGMEVLAKQDKIPSWDTNAIAVKHIEYYP